MPEGFADGVVLWAGSASDELVFAKSSNSKMRCQADLMVAHACAGAVVQ